ncbi:hypothetical protein BRD00_13530 [Halobacteriales archaeon QS_8_69_26]|nr:MAG: hypothetical protein BRD00_13530 [Halobacteriales archaeon QS_8_69_26]
MSLVESAIRTVHLVFAAAWVGGVLFVTLAVLPLAREAELDPDPVSAMTGRLVWISRISALVLLLTGGHMAAAGYTADGLLETTAGNLVLGMVVLWLGLAGLVEVASSRMREQLDQGYLREPARDYLPWFRVASLVGIALLVDAGAITYVG